jgi:hypothetical protein
LSQDAFGIFTVQRLIRAGRYHEARERLKELQHGQVPALESKLSRLIEAQRPRRPWLPVIGCVCATVLIVIGIYLGAALLIMLR